MTLASARFLRTKTKKDPKQNIDKLDHQNKSVHPKKLKKMKRQAQSEKNIYNTHISKDLHPIYKKSSCKSIIAR